MEDKEKYIGLIKWFRDQARDANYGFIQHAKLGDLFFHEKSIKPGEDLNYFRENAVVVFLAQKSIKHKGKLEAIDVKKLDSETDLKFLFNHFISILTEKGKYSDYNTIQKVVYEKISSLLKKSTEVEVIEELCERFKFYINEQSNSKIVFDEDYLTSLFKIGKNLFPEYYDDIVDSIKKYISVELSHKFWLDGYIDICQIDYVSNIILSVSHQEKVKIFYRCSDEDKLNVFFKILYSFELIDNESKLMVIKNFLNLSKEFAIKQYDKIVAETIKHCTAYFNLNLWLEDYHEILDFHNYKLYTITLSPEDQKKFVKKVLKYIHEERVNISIEDFTSINLIDFETSKLLEQIDSSHFDYSTSIILNVILELKRQTNLGTRKDVTLAQHRIYDLILNQINKPKDILQISGFFDECEGRCSISVVEIKNEEGEILERQITYDRNIHNKVKYHPICDGRKAVHKLTNDSIPSEEKIDFWWCANQKCYKPSRILHDSNEWEKYSLLDFLTILKVNFRESDLEIYLSLINKANRFLKHLNCRECKHILYPKGRTAYAFYGVNKFICKEETCSQKDNEIYLSHCLNGYCDMEVDSRDSVKCKPVGLDSESCGWYVCNYCHSCCSTEQLLNRKWVHDNILFSEYKCHLEGHRNLGIVSCKKCGDSMESNEANKEEYERILNWFVLNKDKSKRIHKSGKTKKDKWWFTINRGNDSIQEFRKKLTKYHQVGFQIPDIEEDKNFQLIFEPIDFKKHSKDILTCKNCGCILDLSNDLAKARAIKKFHKVKFVPQPIV